MAEMIFEESPEFKKDKKRLMKRYRTLHDDFERVKHMAIILFHEGIDNRACFEIPGLVRKRHSAFKLKKFACRALCGGANSGLRVTYIYNQVESKVLFIEMYYKGDQSLEDRGKIKTYLSCLENEEI